MLVEINKTDYSKYLVNEYDINEYNDYNSWTDGNGKLHKDVIRTYIQGTLHLKLTESAYNKFLTDIQSVKTDKTYTMKVHVNNLAQAKEITTYMDFYPVIKKDLTSGKIYSIIDISIEQM